MAGKINVLVLGKGGREHALVHALSKSEIVDTLHCAPGNPGIMELAVVHHIDPCARLDIRNLCLTHDIGLVVIGPEDPLVEGVADDLRAAGFPVFGPGAQGAQLEGSKTFAKTFMKRYGIPTADFSICENKEQCEEAIDARKPPYVIKADGLAAGKGVFLTDDPDEAKKICKDLMINKKLGKAGATIVIEDFLPGKELTVFAMTDGTAYRLLAPSRDHKRIYEGDKGPNTGGMGAYAPVNLGGGVMGQVEREVLLPTLAGLKREGIEYRGVLYMGLMLHPDEDGMRISVVEYNARFGDPETQVVLPLFVGDFGKAALACAKGELDRCPDFGNSGYALGVVIASGGYPGSFKKDLPVTGLDAGDDLPDTCVYHAGTKKSPRGVVTDGGRVFTVVGVGGTFAGAKERAYARVERIRFENAYYRRDIGWSE